MNYLLRIAIVLSTIFLIGCTKDDGSITPSQVINNKFTIDNNVDFPTKSCYFEFDEDDDDNNGIPDNYVVWLLNGEMIDNDAKHNSSVGEYLFSLGQNYIGSIEIENSNNPSLVNAAIQTGVTYNCKYHFAYNLSVWPLSPSYFENGIEYGEGNDNQAIVHETANGTISFTNYSVDVSAQTGTLDFDYSFDDGTGINVQGHFDGQILVLFD